MLKLRRKWWIG